MTSTILIVALIAVPLGFLVGQLILNRSSGQRVIKPQIVEVQKVTAQPTESYDPWDEIISPASGETSPNPSYEAMDGKIQRLRSERNELRDSVSALERQVEDMRAEIDGNGAQLVASARLAEKAEDVSRNAGARLVKALAERDEAVERLQIEKASHAETHRSLDGSENYLKLLLGQLEETGTGAEPPTNEIRAQIAELRDTVGRLGNQLRSTDPARVPAARR